MFSLIRRYQEWKIKRAMHRWILEYKYENLDMPWYTDNELQGGPGKWIVAVHHKTLEDCITFMNAVNTRFKDNGRTWRIRNGSTEEVIPGEAFGFGA